MLVQRCEGENNYGVTFACLSEAHSNISIRAGVNIEACGF